jgi:hypothetical protein
VSEYETVPEIRVAPCCTINVVVVIEFGSIGVLNVAVIILTPATLVPDVAALVLLRLTSVPPLTGDVRITVGVIQTFTIPGVSSLQPPIKMTKSKAAVSPAESETLTDSRIIRKKCANRIKAVIGFVDGVFMCPSISC